MPGDVLIIGGGSTGEAFAGALRGFEPDTRITLVERELVGGECSYYACMPSKALLRPAEALAAARLAPGAAEAVTGELDAARVLWHRDQVTGGGDDTSQEEWLADRGRRARARRGDGERARARRRRRAVRLRYERLMIATGSVPSIPPIPGLDEVDYWTNREATTARARSRRASSSSALARSAASWPSSSGRMGAKVALADIADRLLPRDHPDAGALLRRRVRRRGRRHPPGLHNRARRAGDRGAPGGRHRARRPSG